MNGVTDIGGIPMVQTGGYGYGCGEGGWMGMLVLLALLGGRGFGGFGGGYGYGDGGCERREIDMMDRHMDVRFNALQNQVDFNANTAFQTNILDKVCDTNRNIDHNAFALMSSFKDCCCETNRSIDNVNFNTCQQFGNLTHTLDKCCCETNRNIDSVKFQNEKDTCAIIQSSHNDTDRILDYLTQKDLREKDMALSEQRIINAMLPPRAIPSYAAANPYEQYIAPVRVIHEPRHCNCGFNNCGPCGI